MLKLRLFFMLVGTVMLRAQSYDAELRVQVPGVHKPVLAENYNTVFADKKLTRSRRLIISGATLLSAGVATMIAGVIVSTKLQDYNAEKIVATTVFLESSPVLLLSGLPVLSVGIHMKRRWTKISDDLSLHGGILSNGHTGLVLNF